MASWSGWERQLLRALRVPITRANISSLDEWARREGGSARYNPLNTTQGGPGASDYNSVGVKHYRSAASGVRATVATLKNGRYGDIMASLSSGKGLTGGEQSLNTWGTGTWSGSSSKGAGTTPLEASVAGDVAAPAPAFTQDDAMQQGLHALATGHYNPTAGLAALLKAAKATAAAASKANPTAFDAGFNSQPIISAKGGPKEQKAAELVQHYLGVKYVWGGTSPKGFDCSGLLQWVWAHEGVKIPRTSQQQWHAGKAVKGALRPGDAVFFGSTSGPHHVGMYVGNGMFVEAPHTGAVVRVSKLRGRRDYIGARRFA